MTPVFSMLQYINDIFEPADVVFVSLSRSPKDIIFRNQLEIISRRFTNVEVHMVVGEVGAAESFAGPIGRINATLMQAMVPDLGEREIFMCGPEGFMKAARAMARDVQVAALHEESFGGKIATYGTDHGGGEDTLR